MKEDIKSLRKKIDKIDLEILRFLNERANIVFKIGKLKQKDGLEIYSSEREKQIIENLKTKNKGLLSNASVENIFNEIIKSCRSLTKKLKVAYLGPEATFTHQSAIMHFGYNVDFISCRSISDVFNDVSKGYADYGVVPIENSTEGIVTHTLDIFIGSDLKICAERNMPINHCLLSKQKDMNKLKILYTHPQAYAQCRGWIDAHLPNIKIFETTSTAEASKKVAEIGKNTSAIGSTLAAKLYKLNILQEDIGDISDNITRFLIISKTFPDKSGNDKTSIMFSIKDKVGALHEMLSPFKKFNINLTKIESRPTKKKPWEYIFFVDFIGHLKDENVTKALKTLEKLCVELKILGSYPRSE